MPHPRRAIRISQFAAAAGMAVVLMAVPAAVLGQAPAVTKVQNVEKPHPVANSASFGTARMENVSPAAPAVKTEAAKTAAEPAKESQEEQEKGFLENGPIVKWVAQTTGWSRGTASAVFLWANFAIIFFGIAIPLGRVMPKVMRQRRRTLSSSLDEARKATADANARLSAVEAKLSGLDSEIAKYRAQIEEESKSDEVRIKASIEEEKTRIVAGASQELEMATAQARRGLRDLAAGLAIEQAAKQLALTPEADRALIGEFIGDVAKGGKN